MRTVPAAARHTRHRRSARNAAREIGGTLGSPSPTDSDPRSAQPEPVTSGWHGIRNGARCQRLITGAFASKGRLQWEGGGNLKPRLFTMRVHFPEHGVEQ